MSLPRLFRRLSLDLKLIASYLVILGVGGVAISAVGSWIVASTMPSEAQRTVDHDLALARLAYAALPAHGGGDAAFVAAEEASA